MSYHSDRIGSADQSRAAPPRHSLPVHDARRLTEGAGTAMIVLDDKTYTLRITRAGKLILTK
ncbi:hemin uptake protein HemP [Rhodobacterales bacterium HKCCSP123]|nr:hemin uptake protein HemP [Rhodobacterales bacterium HKCCSP123]